jgi:hypothetical protein
MDALKSAAKAEGLAEPSVSLIDADVRGLAARYVEAASAEQSAATIAQQLTKSLAKARKKFLSDQWNATVVSVDVGSLMVSSTGSWGDLQGQQFGTSMAAAVPLGNVGGPGQFVAQVQARKGVGTAPKEDWFYSFGGRALVGSATKRLSLEGVFSKASNVDATLNGVTKRFTVGTEFRVAESFWVELAFGGERTPSTAAGTSLVSLANLKYAFKSSPRYAQIPGADEGK